MKRIRKKIKVGKDFHLKLLLWLCAIWYFVQMAIVSIEFLQPETKIPFFARTIIFVFLLNLYALKHEQSRWMKRLNQGGKGECFVWGWCIFVAMLLVGQFLSHGRLQVPMHAWENLIFIVSVFFGTRISKILYRLKTHGRRFTRYYAIRVILGFRGSRFVCWLMKKAKKRRKILKRLTSSPEKRKDQNNANHFSRAA
jgi:hypothetical protein